MRRRDFIKLASGAAATWPLSGRAEQSAAIIGILDAVGGDAMPAFRNGLAETGYWEDRNVTFAVRSTNEYDRLPGLAADLVGRRVSLIAAIGGPSAPAAKLATSTIPIVFSIGGDPVELGLVGSLRQPGGNITGCLLYTSDAADE